MIPVWITWNISEILDVYAHEFLNESMSVVDTTLDNG